MLIYNSFSKHWTLYLGYTVTDIKHWSIEKQWHLAFFWINMNAPEWLDHGIHVYPLHPTAVECSKTWNPLTWPLSVPPEARKDGLGLLERTVLPEGVCQPQVIVNQRHGSWINSLGSFKLFWKIFVKLGNLPPRGASKVFEVVVVENGTTS